MAIVSVNSGNNARFIFSLAVIPRNAKVIELGDSTNLVKFSDTNKERKYVLSPVLAENEEDILQALERMIKLCKEMNILDEDKLAKISEASRFKNIIED